MPKYSYNLFNLKRNQYILYVLILTLVVAFFWIAGSLFSSQRSTGVSAEIQRLAIPLNPNIDAEIFNQIQNKQVFQEDELFDFPIYMISRSEEDGSQQIVPIGSDLMNNPQTLSDVADQVIEDASESPDATSSADNQLDTDTLDSFQTTESTL